MKNSINPIKDFQTGETTDVMETVLFANISVNNLKTSKVKDMLPIVNLIKANSKFDLKGVNKFLYYKDMNIELIKLVTQN